MASKPPQRTAPLTLPGAAVAAVGGGICGGSWNRRRRRRRRGCSGALLSALEASLESSHSAIAPRASSYVPKLIQAMGTTRRLAAPMPLHLFSAHTSLIDCHAQPAAAESAAGEDE